MMKLALAGAALIGALAAVPAHAARYSPLSGESLVRACTGGNEARVSECQAYIDGVSDTITSYQASRPEDGSKGAPLPAYICVPGRLTGPQLREEVISWLRQNQSGLRVQASVDVIRAFRALYPCEQHEQQK